VRIFGPLIHYEQISVTPSQRFSHRRFGSLTCRDISRYGIDRHQVSYLLDLQRLKEFIATYQAADPASRIDNDGSHIEVNFSFKDEPVRLPEVAEAL
jgi:hypothetical protein